MRVHFNRKEAMQKFLFTSIAVLITLGLVFLSSPVLAQDVDTHDGTTTNGTVPFAASWELTEPDVSAFTDSVDIAAYDADWIIINDLIAITDFDCNTMFKITATKGGWTLPGLYGGAKETDGTDSDLLLMVDNITAGYASDGLAALGTYAAFTVIVPAGSDIIGGGSLGGGQNEAHGVENAACDINARILMDWATDVVGAYSITVTLTISEVN